MGRLSIALINTAIIIAGMLLSGFAIDAIVNSIAITLYKYCGRFITMLVMNYLTFVGVIHHELSHALFAFFTGADIVKVDLFKVTNNTLGQVMYRTRGNMFMRSIQDTLSAIAPMVTGVFSEYMLYSLLTTHQLTGGGKLIILYVMVSILCHMSLSVQDIKMMLRGLPIFALLVFLFMYITKFNILAYIRAGA